jgi:CDP-4-dehydro-6-deoxyglucose reductase
MSGRVYKCKILSTEKLNPTVLRIVFEPNRTIHYEPGQFLSVLVPTQPKEVRRFYSFASAPETANNHGYEICVKLHENGIGSGYLSTLRVGDSFQVTAPYGDFQYTPPKLDRSVCLIGTGTGVGPLRAIVESHAFQSNLPEVSCLVGVKTPKDVLFPGLLESLGVPVNYCFSQLEKAKAGFSGRLTKYIESLPPTFPWKLTDFYLCGNKNMIEEVKEHLIQLRGVNPKAIRQDIFFSLSRPTEEVLPALITKKAA